MIALRTVVRVSYDEAVVVGKDRANHWTGAVQWGAQVQSGLAYL